MNTKIGTTWRRYDFDWLRVLLTLAVLVFHSLRFFNLEGWGIQNTTTYLSAEVLADTGHVSHLPDRSGFRFR